MQQEQQREDRFVILRFEVLQRKDLTPSEKLVYARICGFRQYFEASECCADILGLSKDTVIKAKQKLVVLGYIKEIGNTGRGKIYQAVYDDAPAQVPSTNQSGTNLPVRVVKSTSQSGKKPPVRVVKSTTIDKRENKDRIKYIANAMGETPLNYGNEEINNLFEYWSTTVGYTISAQTQDNRNACSNMLKKHGYEQMTKAIDQVAKSQTEQFAPAVSDFCTLQTKWNALAAWSKRDRSKQVILNPNAIGDTNNQVLSIPDKRDQADVYQAARQKADEIRRKFGWYNTVTN